MHLELPKARLESFRDFAKHYLMIVLSILTALGLEAWIEHAHHAHSAAEASARIEAEMRANLDQVDRALAQDGRRAERLAAIRDGLQQDFKAHVPEATIVQHIQAQVATKNFNLNLKWPTLRHEAWDVAVADQSASWIDKDRMRRYSAAYASQRDVSTSLNMNLALVMNGPRMIDMLTDLGSGDVQPRDFLHVVSQMATMLDQAQQNLETLQRHLRDALPTPVAAHR
ncbi:hypothetical protein QMK61_01960 [Fulvimonas sp. R45]|uniref:hypothetical protein n=1 Tax=Fulvimonas sp. R45 TaxID=3045937 RepID=UPI00265EC494|nr:hypothetical protein [Fulvimonas sp. R45]MDO1527584.1 hypothetical protein [Fulvimonas sp. R45]